MSVSKESHHFVDSDYTKDFRGSCGQAGVNGLCSTFANIQIDKNVLTGAARLFVNSIRILSMQPLDWRVEFYSKSGAYGAVNNPNNTNLISSVGPFPATPWTYVVTGASYTSTSEPTSVERYATAFGTMFVYVANGLRIPIADFDPTGGQTGTGGAIHANLVNLSATAKSAGDLGAVQIRFGVIAAA